MAPAAVFTSPEERPTCVSFADTFSVAAGAGAGAGTGAGAGAAATGAGAVVKGRCGHTGVGTPGGTPEHWGYTKNTWVYTPRSLNIVLGL